MPTARLGLVVGKRAVRRAVDRNRVKRVLREEYRRTREGLARLDIVIQVTGPATNESLRAAYAAILLDLRTSA
jgi:ribonuclease P protein component